MLKDGQGLDISTDSPETIAAIDAFLEQLMSYGNQTSVVLGAAAADPNSAIAHAHAAAYYLAKQTPSTVPIAAHHLDQAKAIRHSNPREQWYIAAIDAWANRDIHRALTYHEAIAEAYPRDLISLQIAYDHYFNLGQKEQLLHLLQKVLPANSENPHLHGMLAFILEQCHQLEAAEIAGRSANEMNRHNPRAHHAVAHVLETQKRSAEGITWLESVCDTWQVGSTIYSHNWWHLALYYLARGSFNRVLELYDAYIWGCANQSFPQDQVGAIALLLRLELQGIDVGDRWQAILPAIRPYLRDHLSPFFDLQYLYAIAKAGESELAIEILQSMKDYAQIALPSVQKTWLTVTLPVAEAMLAHVNQDWDQVVDRLRITLPKLHEIGGSNAERDLFNQIYRDAQEHLQVSL